jgi:hypothetical protein
MDKWFVLQAKAIMELLEVCLRTAAVLYLLCGALSPALDLAQHKPSLWLCYIHDKFVIWPHGPEQV